MLQSSEYCYAPTAIAQLLEDALDSSCWYSLLVIPALSKRLSIVVGFQ